MPRYQFGLRNLDHSELDDEPEGIDLPDDNTACEFALKIIRGLVQKGDDWENWVMEVTQGRRRVWRLLFDLIEPSDP